jgi:hypothetical protein
MLAHESFDTLVVTAATSGSAGLLPDDISWLLANVPGEIIVIRPGATAVDLAPLRARRRWRRQSVKR